MAVPSFSFGTGNWEVEFWLRMTDFNTMYGTIIGNATSGFSPQSMFVMVYGDNFATVGQRRKLAVGGFSALTGGVNYELGGNPLCISDEMPLGQLEHVVVNKVGNLVRIWQRGTLKGSGTSSAVWNFESNGLLFGRNGWDGAGSFLSASIVDMKVRAVPIRTAAFTPPPAPAPGLVRESTAIVTNHPGFDAVCNGGAFVASANSAGYRYATDGAGGTNVAQGLCGASAALSKPTMVEAGGLMGRDVEFGGVGRIWGANEIEIAGSQKIPSGGRVVLFRQRDKLVVRQTWADPVTGAWAFDGVDAAQSYLVLAEDLEGNYRPVAANKLVPEVVV